MPAVLYCIDHAPSPEDAIDIIHKVGGLTHTHIRSNIAGGLAGLYYGYDAIPEDWLAALQRREWIESLCAGTNE